MGGCSIIGFSIVLIVSLIESSVISSCLPEFKGTYDEDQDSLLAVDWD